VVDDDVVAEGNGVERGELGEPHAIAADAKLANANRTRRTLSHPVRTRCPLVRARGLNVSTFNGHRPSLRWCVTISTPATSLLVLVAEVRPFRPHSAVRAMLVSLRRCTSRYVLRR